MPTPTPCVPCCPTIQTVSIPGIDGSDGAVGPEGPQGPAGADGVLAGVDIFTQPDDFNTANAAGVFAGFADTAATIITPAASGRVLILITAIVGNGAVGATTSVQIRYGTGAAPVGGDLLAVGTVVGAVKIFKASTAAGRQGVALSGMVTGLAVGTPYWIDISVTPSSNTAFVSGSDVVAIEL